MRSKLNLFIAVLLWLAALSVQAALTRVSLILSADPAKPGDTVIAGVQLRMDPHWHTYWKNHGASGLSTSIQWNLPAGITAGEIEWPVPEKFPPDDLTTYGYENEVVLLVPLKLAPDLAPGLHELKAKVAWLECEQSCIPGSAEVIVSLNVGNETKASPDAELIQTWQKKLPESGKDLSARAWWVSSAKGDMRPLVLEWNGSGVAGDADFYPLDGDQIEVQGATERLPADAGKIKLRKLVKKFQGDWPKQVSGLLIQKTGEKRAAFAVTLPVSESTPPSQPLGRMLVYAFFGGMILNVMPCVLPVIALKILGFVGEVQNDRRRLRKLGLVYGLGVLISFFALVLVVIGLKAGGQRVGWGMQFGSPYFLIAMTVLLALIALNLFGVFEVTLGGRAMGAAAELSSGHGAVGAFFNGLLATVLATSCTAPLLGTAVGFALLSGASYWILMLVFLAVGAGLAAPYVVLSWQPAWLKLLPKPGVWMEKFKIAMGFPMLAAAVWLCSLVSTYYGDRAWALAVFLVFVGLAAWVFGEFVQRSSRRRALAWATTLLLLLVGYAYALEGQLRWREPIQGGSTAEPLALSPQGGSWQPWSVEAVAAARKEGRPVLVDFTARWCQTCQKDVKPVLESSSVRSKLEEIKAVTLLADYTRFPEDIYQELNRHGRAGVPLVLIYPRKGDDAPIVLPEFITRGMVLDALERAAN